MVSPVSDTHPVYDAHSVAGAPPPHDANPGQILQLLSAHLAHHPSVGILTSPIVLQPGQSPQSVQRSWTALLRTTSALRVRFENVAGRLVYRFRTFEELPEESRQVAVL